MASYNNSVNANWWMLQHMEKQEGLHADSQGEYSTVHD